MPEWSAQTNWNTGGYVSSWLPQNQEVIFNRNMSNPLGGFMMRPMFDSPAMAFVKPEYMALFVEGDLRRSIYSNNNGELSNFRRNARGQHNEGVDLPAFYLFYAESLARTGNLTKARELLTHLRKHRFETDEQAVIPSNVNTREELIVFTVEERLREYMSTGHRWFDMRRLWHDPLFQHLKANYTHTDGINTWTLTEERLTFRIPPAVMVFNPDWTNNP
jgi:hypothetical protein